MTSTPRPLVVRRNLATVPAADNEASHEKIAEEVRRYLEGFLRLLSGYEQLEVKVVFGEKTTIFDVNCRQEDFGRILGKNGKNIESFRQICSAVTAKCGFRSIVNLPYFPHK